MEEEEIKNRQEEEPEVKSDPSSFLREITGANVVVKLNSGIEYRGKLQSVDGFMNIALEGTREFSDKQLISEYGDVFIRGNNGMLNSSQLSILMALTQFYTYRPHRGLYDGPTEGTVVRTSYFISKVS